VGDSASTPRPRSFLRTSGPNAVAVATALVGVLTIGLVVGLDPDIGPSTHFFALLVLQSANYVVAEWLARRFRVPVWQLDAALLTAALVLLEPAGVVISQAAGVVVAGLVLRRPVRSIVNFAQASTATAVAAGLTHVIGGGDVATDRFAVTVLLASAV